MWLDSMLSRGNATGRHYTSRITPHSSREVLKLKSCSPPPILVYKQISISKLITNIHHQSISLSEETLSLLKPFAKMSLTSKIVCKKHGDGGYDYHDPAACIILEGDGDGDDDDDNDGDYDYAPAA